MSTVHRPPQRLLLLHSSNSSSSSNLFNCNLCSSSSIHHSSTNIHLFNMDSLTNSINVNPDPLAWTSQSSLDSDSDSDSSFNSRFNFGEYKVCHEDYTWQCKLIEKLQKEYPLRSIEILDGPKFNTNPVRTVMILGRREGDGRSQVILKMAPGGPQSVSSAEFIDGYGGLDAYFRETTEGISTIVLIRLRFRTAKISISKKPPYYREREFYMTLEDTIKSNVDERDFITVLITLRGYYGKTMSEFFQNWSRPIDFGTHSKTPVVFSDEIQYSGWWKIASKSYLSHMRNKWEKLNEKDLHAVFEKVQPELYRVIFRSYQEEDKWKNIGGEGFRQSGDEDFKLKPQTGLQFELTWPGCKGQFIGTVTDIDVEIVRKDKNIKLSMLIGIPINDFPQDGDDMHFEAHVIIDESGLKKTIRALDKIEKAISLKPTPPKAAGIYNTIILGTLAKKIEVEPLTAAAREQSLKNGLDESQISAAQKVLSHNLTLVQGASGTGKSMLLLRIIHAWFAEYLLNPERPHPGKVLVTVPSNQAADELALGFSTVYGGLPEDILGLIKVIRFKGADKSGVALDPVAATAEANQNRHHVDAKVDIHHLRCRADEDYGDLFDKHNRNQLDKEEAFDFLRLQTGLDKDILKDANIVFTTCYSAGNQSIQRYFPAVLVLVDEAHRASEPEGIVPLGLTTIQQAAFFGDHCQIPPGSLDRFPSLEHSLMERLMLRDQPLDDYREGPAAAFLEYSYRSPEAVAKLVSDIWYRPERVSSIATLSESLELDHVYVPSTMVPQSVYNTLCENVFGFVSPLVWIHSTSSEYYGPAKNPATLISKRNKGNAELIRVLLGKCYDTIEDYPELFHIVCLYAAQTTEVKKALELFPFPIEITTVDAYHGSGEEILILDLTRSNHLAEVGFMVEHRRLNTAITRAKKGVFVIGNWRMFAQSPEFTCGAKNRRVPELFEFARYNRSNVVVYENGKFSKRDIGREMVESASLDWWCRTERAENQA